MDLRRTTSLLPNFFMNPVFLPTIAISLILCLLASTYNLD